MSLDEELSRSGGRWVKLTNKGDQLVGTVIDINTDKKRTDLDGNVVLSKKSGEPRRVYGLLIQTDEGDGSEDDGKRRFDANESAQGAIREAFKTWRTDNPTGGVEGCQFMLKVVAEAEDQWSQAEYKAKFGARVEPTAAADEEEEPF